MSTQTTPARKVECLNPNTGGRMNIEASTYAIFSTAIRESLSGGEELTYTELVKKIKEWMQKQKQPFDGSVEWYAVTVKNDLEAKGVIEVYTNNGKKRNRLNKKEPL